MSTERRLAAILAADVVGYSRLMGHDEAGTLRALKALRTEVTDPKIAEHKGRVFKTTGDGVLAEFPSVVNAVACAVSIQSQMAGRNADRSDGHAMQLRIGINLGDVVVEGEDLLGDGVNLAARLEGIAPPGGIAIAAVVHDQIGNRLDLQFESMGEQSLKNIDRPVKAYSVRLEGMAAEASTKLSLSLPDKPSIAVLPFHNMSDDTSQEYFADGMVEDIITGLSRIKWLFVIARNSSFVYKARSVDVRQVGRDLGVRYILEGSVRRLGNQLRVTAQLVEAATGAHLWADRYDGAVGEVFDFQDSITERVVGIVEPSVRKSEIERSRRKRQENLDAYDLFLRAMPHLRAHLPDEARIAIPYLQKALALDPNYHVARAHLAWCYEWCFTRGGLNEEDRATALLHARATLASDTDDAASLAIAGWIVVLLAKESAIAVDAIKRALAINPSCATAHYFAALVDAFAGRASSARSHAEQALRLNPLDPWAFEAYVALGFVAMSEGLTDEAIEQFATAARINPRHSLFPFCHAIALALSGRLEDGKISARKGLELEPSFRIRIFKEFGMAPALSEKFIEGARMLELPE